MTILWNRKFYCVQDATLNVVTKVLIDFNQFVPAHMATSLHIQFAILCTSN